MTAADIFDHVARLETRCRELQAWQARSVDVTRFENVGMTTEEVARFLKMRPSTVRNYSRYDLIPKHPASTDAKLLFKASEVLKLTGEGLKRAKRRIKWKLRSNEAES